MRQAKEGKINILEREHCGDCVFLTYEECDESNMSLAKTNIALCAMITSHARCRLYDVTDRRCALHRCACAMVPDDLWHRRHQFVFKQSPGVRVFGNDSTLRACICTLLLLHMGVLCCRRLTAIARQGARSRRTFHRRLLAGSSVRVLARGNRLRRLFLAFPRASPAAALHPRSECGSRLTCAAHEVPGPRQDDSVERDPSQ